MTLSQVQDVVNTVLDIGTPGVLVLILLGMWKGWIVPKREVDDLRETIKAQASTIDVLEAANDKLLDEIAKPLAQVLASLPTVPARRR